MNIVSVSNCWRLTMHKKKVFQRAAIAVIIVIVGAFTWGSVVAATPTDTKELVIDFGDSFDLSIGRSGVSQASSGFSGTAIIEKYEHPPNYGLSWHVWTQRLMDVRIYDTTGRIYPFMNGIVQVYFELDPTQRKIWDRNGSNMSIWHHDIRKGRWVKCPTAIVFDLQHYPDGRLVCPITYFGLYGVGWTQPTMEMKLTKAGPSPTPTITPTPTLTPIP